MTEIAHRLIQARLTVHYTFDAACHIDPVLVKPWDEYTPAEQAEFFDHGPIPCEGSFEPGRWCDTCRFGQNSADEEEYREP